jgi:phosphate uptake regulator
MFRQLYSALTSENTLEQAFEDLTQMLDHSAWMFDRATAVLFSMVPVEEVKQPLYDRDRAINDLERSIRRKVMRHLTINPGHDVAICLALMSVAKDAERIGDYCKNVFEIGTVYTEGFHVERYQAPLDKMADEIFGMFNTLSTATKESNEEQARAIMHQSLDVRHQCDKIITSLLNDPEPIEFHEAVAYSLLARHYKRVVSHLGNVATAVTGNLEDLDFFSGE